MEGQISALWQAVYEQGGFAVVEGFQLNTESSGLFGAFVELALQPNAGVGREHPKVVITSARVFCSGERVAATRNSPAFQESENLVFKRLASSVVVKE